MGIIRDLTLEEMVWVLNQNAFDFEDFCDGIKFVFPKGRRARVQAIVANHFFGYGAQRTLADAERQYEMNRSTPNAEALRKAREWANEERTRAMTRRRWNVDEQGRFNKDGAKILANFVIEPCKEETAAVLENPAA